MSQNRLISAGLALLAALGAGALAAAVVQPRAVFAGFGFLALLVVLAPLAGQKRYDLFSPWSFVILAVLLGVTLRGLGISLGWGGESNIQRLYLMGESPAFFVWPSILLLIGLAALTVGFWGTGGARKPRLIVPVSFTPWRVAAVAAACVLTAATGVGLYLHATGGLDLTSISAKRALIRDLADPSGVRQYGYLLQTSKLATFAYLLVLAETLFLRQRITRARWLILIFLFALACALPFYTSNRQPIAWLACFSAALVYYSAANLSDRRRSLREAVIWVTVALALVHVMTLLRHGGVSRLESAEPLEVSAAFESLLLNRSFLGIAKTAHIVNAVPEKIGLRYGQTIVNFFVAPIPRDLWPQKPVVHPGPELGRKLFGTSAGGVPPGLIAELYWNFHLPGLIIGCFLFGWALRSLRDRFLPVPARNPHSALLYVVGPMKLGFDALGGALGYAIFHTAIDMIGMWLLVQLVASARSSRLRRIDIGNSAELGAG